MSANFKDFDSIGVGANTAPAQSTPPQQQTNNPFQDFGSIGAPSTQTQPTGDDLYIGGKRANTIDQAKAIITANANRLKVPINIAMNQASWESRGTFDMNVTSPEARKSGSVGIYQIIPADHRDIKNPWDINQNISGGLSLLKDYYNKYHSWVLALAAYNAGESTVQHGTWMHIDSTVKYINGILGPGTVDAFIKSGSKPAKDQRAEQPPLVTALLNNPAPELTMPGQPDKGYGGGAGKLTLGSSSQDSSALSIDQRIQQGFLNRMPIGPMAAPEARTSAGQAVLKAMGFGPQTPEQRRQASSPASIILSPVVGYARGRAGVPLVIQHVKGQPSWNPLSYTLDLDPDSWAGKEEEKFFNWVRGKFGEKPINASNGPYEQIATNQALAFSGEVVGAVQNFGMTKGLIDRGAIWTATKAPGAAGALTAGMQRMGISSQARLLIPMITGVGGTTMLNDVLTETFDKGYVDPKVVGYDAALNMAVGFIAPAVTPLFARTVGKAFSLAPQILKFAPVLFGGAPINASGEATLAGVTKGIWRAATQAARVANTGINKLPLNIAQHWDGLANMADFMDAFLETGFTEWQYPSWMWSGSGTFPLWSQIKPQKLMRALELAANPQRISIQRRIGRITQLIPDQAHNAGGTFTGKVFGDEVIDELDGVIADIRKGNKWIFEKQNADRLQNAVNVLRENSGNMSQQDWRRFASYIDQVRELGGVPGGRNVRQRYRIGRFYREVPGIRGNRIVPTQEGQVLDFLKNMAREQAERSDVLVAGPGIARGAISHIVIGLGNVASALTILTRIGFALATDGPENTAWGALEMKNNAAWRRKVLTALGFEKLPSGVPSVPKTLAERLSEASFSLYDWAERQTLPTTVGARYATLMKQPGMSPGRAFNEALDWARRLRTSSSYDRPLVSIGPGFPKAALRLSMQFFPFAFKSAQAASNFGMEELGNYIGYTAAFAGIKGIPFATVADRILAGYTGHSIMNAMLANPTMNRILSGLPGMVFGVDIGSRHNWSAALVNRIFALQPVPFTNYSGQLQSAYLNLLKNPLTGAAYVKALKASMPVGGPFGQDMFKALDDEEHGSIMDSSFYPLVQNPTPAEYALTAWGFMPTSVSSEQALNSLSIESQQYRAARNKALEDNLARVIQGGTQKEVDDAIDLMAQNGMTHTQIKNVYDRVSRDPARFRIKRTSRQDRPMFLPYLEQTR